MTRKLLIAGNWKMNTDTDSGVKLANQLKSGISEQVFDLVDILVCPPSINLYPVKSELQHSKISVGGQNCYFENSGAFTGEISPSMLKSLDLDYCIIGHSERRTIFNENDTTINLKLKALLTEGIKPILCVGEKLEERESGKTFEVIKNQLESGLKDIEKSDISKVVIAYEPVWAIGTGVSASTKQAQEAHLFIRNYLKENYGDASESINILYGGSLKPENAEELLTQEDIDGGLIGGASLKSDSFLNIIETAAKLAH